MVNLNRRHFLTAGLGTVAVVGLAACQQTPGTQTSGSPTVEKPALPPTAWVRADAADVAEGGTLRLSITSMIAQLNGNHPDGNEVGVADMRAPMGAGFAQKASESGEVSVNPDYLIEAKLTSESPQIVTVKMNPKAVWDDGTPINFANLAAYAEAMSGKNKDFRVTSTQGWQQIKEAKQTTDEFTGELHFDPPLADWIAYTYPDLPTAACKDAKLFNEGYLGKFPPSCGPFKPKSMDNSVVTLERNDKWWGEKAKLDTIIFKVVTQQQAPSAFGNSEIDAIDVPNGDIYATAKKRADAEILKSLGLSWSHATLNTGSGALADLEVRRAMAYAINREIIAQAVIGPLEAPVVLMNNVVYMPGQAGYEDSWGGQVKHDTAKAEEILKAAGYVKGADGVLAKDGKALSFKIVVPAEVKSNADRAAQMQKDLNGVGFKIELQTVPSDKYFSDYIVAKSYDMATFGWRGTVFPITPGINLFSPKESEQNFTNWSDPKADSEGKQAIEMFDPAQRTKHAQEFSKIVMNAFPVIPFYATPNVVAIKKGLVNYGPSQFESTNWSIVGFKK